jgi:hypothetical protein
MFQVDDQFLFFNFKSHLLLENDFFTINNHKIIFIIKLLI